MLFWVYCILLFSFHFCSPYILVWCIAWLVSHWMCSGQVTAWSGCHCYTVLPWCMRHCDCEAKSVPTPGATVTTGITIIWWYVHLYMYVCMYVYTYWYMCVNIGCCPVCWQGLLRGGHDGTTWWSGTATLMGRDKKHDHTSEHNIPSIHHYYTTITGYFLIPNP